MPAIYDSGWVPYASGAISATVLPDASYYMLVVAASGATGTNIGAKWQAGGSTPTPRSPRTPEYNCASLPTGDLGLTTTQATASATYYTFGAGLSGSTNWKGPAWPALVISGTAASGGLLRMIVEG